MKDLYPLYSNDQANRTSGYPNRMREGFSRSMVQWSETASSVTREEVGLKLRRRKRTSFSQEQILAMESVFSSNRYPNIYLRETLAELIGQPESRIHVWFQNRRAKHRRQNTEAPPSATIQPGVPLPCYGPNQAQPCVAEGRSRQFQEGSAQGPSPSGEGLGPSHAGNRWTTKEGDPSPPHGHSMGDRPFGASNQVKIEAEDPSPQVTEAAGDMKTALGRNQMAVFEGDHHYFHTCATGSEIDVEALPSASSTCPLTPRTDPTRHHSVWECVGRFPPISEVGDPRSDWEECATSLEAHARTPRNARGEFF